MASGFAVAMAIEDYVADSAQKARDGGKESSLKIAKVTRVPPEPGSYRETEDDPSDGYPKFFVEFKGGPSNQEEIEVEFWSDDLRERVGKNDIVLVENKDNILIAVAILD